MVMTPMISTATSQPVTKSQKYPHSISKNTKPSNQYQIQNITRYNVTTNHGRTRIDYWMMDFMGLRLGLTIAQGHA